MLITGLLGDTKPGFNAGLLSGRVGLTSDGEKARFILDDSHYSVKNHLNITYYADSHYFFGNIKNKEASK